jgi:hypothetical protein
MRMFGVVRSETLGRCDWVGRVALLMVVLATNAVEAAPLQFVFEHTEPAAAPARGGKPPAGNAQRVTRLVRRMLERRATDGDSTVIFNLFANREFLGVVEASIPQGKGRFASRGRIEEPAAGTFEFVVQDALAAGTIVVGTMRYQVLQTAATGECTITETDLAQLPPCGCDARHAVQAPQQLKPIPQAAVGRDNGSLLDVMVVYTQSARAAVGGTTAMLGLISLAIQESNTALQNSGVNPRFRLVHSAEVNYNESAGNYQALLDLTDTNDGKMDSVHSLRNQYGADLVCLLLNSDESCGNGWVMQNASTTFEDQAFCTVHYSCATGNYSFAHELGHNQGLQHDFANAGFQGVAPYAYGWRWTGTNNVQYRSVMAYAPGTRVQQFSSPLRTFQGTATGVANQADNARSLNETANIVSNFRQSVAPNSPTITSSLSAAATVNQFFSYQITASGSPISFGASGLPAGLSVNTNTGVISGTPSGPAGLSLVTISATNNGGTGSAVMSLDVYSQSCGLRTAAWLRKAMKSIGSTAGLLSAHELPDGETLQTLRRFRDEVLKSSVAGRQLMDDYYHHSAEVSRLLLVSPALAVQMMSVADDVLPAVNATLESGEPLRLTASQVEAIDRLVDDLQQVGSPALKHALEQHRSVLRPAGQSELGAVLIDWSGARPQSIVMAPVAERPVSAESVLPARR